MGSRYFYSSEMITYLFCVIIFLFDLYNSPKKTKNCILCLAGIFALWVEMGFEALLYVYSLAASTYNPGVINVALFIQLIGHFVMMVCLYLYIDELSSSHHLTGKYFIGFLTTFFVVYLFAFLLLASKNVLYEVVDGLFYVRNYIVFVSFASILGTLITFIYVLTHPREFPKALTVTMYYSFPLMLFLQTVQIFRNTIVFHGIIYGFPLVILYFFYHNNPYDLLTGYQDALSFDSKFQNYMVKKKDFHMVYVTVPGLKDSILTQTSTNFKGSKAQLSLIKACRNIEYNIRKAKLYKINDYSFAILFLSKGKEKDAESISQIKEVIENTLANNSMDLYFHAAHFQMFNSIDSNINYFSQEFVYYILTNNASIAENKWIEVLDSDYDSFMEIKKIDQAVREISSRKNLDDTRVMCYAQPIFHVHSGKYRTAEALMRMEIDGKTIYPDKFIPIAERLGCIHELTLVMLNKVCKFINGLKDEYEFDAITVNCSSAELSKPSFCDDVESIITKNGVNPSQIRIELTESAMFDNYDLIVQNITRLKDFGIKFYLDDFGTGYSNFERILSCPLYTIKFDKSLLYKAQTNKSIDSMISTMIALFKSNGLNVLVEGVEDSEQRDFAIQRGFESIQGYYYAKPMPIHRLTEFFYQK